jgi:hypothetical protein
MLVWKMRHVCVPVARVPLHSHPRLTEHLVCNVACCTYQGSLYTFRMYTGPLHATQVKVAGIPHPTLRLLSHLPHLCKAACDSIAKACHVDPSSKHSIDFNSLAPLSFTQRGEVVHSRRGVRWCLCCMRRGASQDLPHQSSRLLPLQVATFGPFAHCCNIVCCLWRCCLHMADALNTRNSARPVLSLPSGTPQQPFYSALVAAIECMRLAQSVMLEPIVQYRMMCGRVGDWASCSPSSSFVDTQGAAGRRTERSRALGKRLHALKPCPPPLQV